MSVHPLFDPRSAYRNATEETIWIDGGRSSIQRYFEGRLRQSLLKEGLAEVPAEATEYGYSRAANQLLDHFRTIPSKVAHLAQTIVEIGTQRLNELNPVPVLAAAAQASPPPALLIFDLLNSDSLKLVGKWRFPQMPADTISGCSPNAAKSLDCFEVDLQLHPYRLSLIFLFSPARLQQLADVFGEEFPDNDDGVLKLLQKCLDSKALTATQREPGKSSLASRLFDILRLVPTLEGISNQQGKLTIKVDLGCQCPIIDPGTWAVVCEGPAV